MNEQAPMELFLSRVVDRGFNTKVSLGLPAPIDGVGINTRVTATVTGEMFKPYKLHYDYYRPTYTPLRNAVELIYEDEDDETTNLLVTLSEHCSVPFEFIKEALPGKVKRYLTKDSPLGHKRIKVDNYECVFEQDVEFAPRRLDVKYIFNEIVTNKNGNIVFRHERQDKELANFQPVWKMLKDKVDEVDNLVVKKPTVQESDMVEDFVFNIEGNNQDGN